MEAGKDTSEEAGQAFAKGLSPELVNPNQQLGMSNFADGRWCSRLADVMLTGTFFSGGSGMHPRWAILRRAASARCKSREMGMADAAMPLEWRSIARRNA